jgi:DNA-binding LacI/PurR family transcriptional regulator
MADRTIAELRDEEELPFVLLNRATRAAGDLAVVVDNRAAAVGAVAHLAALGHHRVGHIAGPQNTTTGLERLEGYRAGVRAHGLSDDAGLVVEADAFTVDAGSRALAVEVQALETEQRTRELARMLAGARPSEEALAHAGEMLARARKLAKAGKN